MKRNDITLNMDILKACSKPLTITGILYETHINCTEIYKRIEFLEAKGFLTVTEKQEKTNFAVHNNHRIPNHSLSKTPHNHTKRYIQTTDSGRALLKLWATFSAQYDKPLIMVVNMSGENKTK